MRIAGISAAKLTISIGLAGFLVATATVSLQAQQAADPPPWKQGMSPAASSSTLAPIAPPPLPTAADKLPLDKLKVAQGLKIEVYAAGVPNARTLRLGEHFLSCWPSQHFFGGWRRDCGIGTTEHSR